MESKYCIVFTGINQIGEPIPGQRIEFSTIGSHDIGRGILGIEEKKCSRKQLTINIKKDHSITVNSSAINPSYLKKSNQDYFTLMNKSEEYKLEDGDHFSLLYEKYTFSVSIKDNKKNSIGTTGGGNSSSINKRKEPDQIGNQQQQQQQQKTDNNAIKIIEKKSQPSTMMDQDIQQKTKNNDYDEEDDSPQPPPNKKPCPFGSNCYRKNPDHFIQFSHPNDFKNDNNINSNSKPQPQQSKQISTGTGVNKTNNNDKMDHLTVPNKQLSDNEDNDSKSPQKKIQKTTTNNSIPDLNIPTTNTQQPTTKSSTINVQKDTTTSTSTTNQEQTNNNNSNDNNNLNSLNVTQIIGPKYRKKKMGDTKKRTLAFPFISTSIYNFDIEKASEIAFKAIQGYLNFHDKVDDIGLKMIVDKEHYSQTLQLFKKYFNNNWDSRFEILSIDDWNSINQLNLNCRIFAIETSWRLKKTPQNKFFYDELLGPKFESDTKARFPNPGKIGKVYPVPLTSESKFKKEYGVDYVLLVLGPNMNPVKPDCFKDYKESSPILSETYHALFSAIDTIDKLENKIKSDKEELQEIELLLEDDPNNDELLTMKSELVELIKTSSELLIQKTRNQQQLQQSNNNIVDDINNNNNNTPSPPISTTTSSTTNQIKKKEDESGKIGIGTACEAKYSVDGIWYNAVITGINKDGTYFVTYTDYGNTESLNLENIRPPTRSQKLIDNQQLEQKKYLITPDAIQEIPKSLKVLPTDSDDVKKQKLKKIHSIKSQNRLKLQDEQSKKKKQAWQDFQNKQKKTVPLSYTDKKKGSMFSTPDNLNGKVGVIGSGRGMTETQSFQSISKKSCTIISNPNGI
eukprot:gene3618-4504_t